MTIPVQIGVGAVPGGVDFSHCDVMVTWHPNKMFLPVRFGVGAYERSTNLVVHGAHNCHNGRLKLPVRRRPDRCL